MNLLVTTSLLCVVGILGSTISLAADTGTDTIETVCGSGHAGNSGDNLPAIKAELNHPFGVCFTPKGDMLIADSGNHSIRKVDPSGIITTVVGSGRKGYSGDNGPATAATMNEPYAVACNKAGDIFVADRLNACVRYIPASSGNIYTLAGTGVKGYNGDEFIATRAQLTEPNGLALDGEHSLLIADVGDNRIRRVDFNTGVISTVAGTGKLSGMGDGDLASESSINGARAVAVNKQGSIFICERSGNRIREIDYRTGIIRTISGTGKAGYTGDGRASILATFNGPKWVSIDELGNLYVADTENHCIRRIASDSGVVTTVAGVGKPGFAGDGGMGTKALLSRPHGCCVNKSMLYIVDSDNNRIRKLKLRP